MKHGCYRLKLKSGLIVFALYVAVWIAAFINIEESFGPWVTSNPVYLWVLANFYIAPALIFGLVWCFVLASFWKSRVTVKVALILISVYSVAWVEVFVVFLFNNTGSYLPIYRWALANMPWVPLFDALTFTVLGIYRFAKRQKKAATLFG